MAKKKRVLFFSGGEIDKDGQMHQWTVAKCKGAPPEELLALACQIIRTATGDKTF